MPEENFTTDGLVGDTHVMSATPAVAVGSETQPATDAPAAITLEELNKTLGKSFKDKESALKAFSDTFSYVGKKKEDIEKEVMQKVSVPDASALAQEIKSMKKELFYRDNPALSQYREVIDSLGDSPAEVVARPAFKSIIEKARGFDESQSLKTVLETNPRIAAQRDSLSKARDMAFKGSGSKAEIEAEVLKSLGL